MLGWFKKKFGRKKEQEQQVEPLEQERVEDAALPEPEVAPGDTLSHEEPSIKTPSAVQPEDSVAEGGEESEVAQPSGSTPEVVSQPEELAPPEKEALADLEEAVSETIEDEGVQPEAELDQQDAAEQEVADQPEVVGEDVAPLPDEGDAAAEQPDMEEAEPEAEEAAEEEGGALPEEPEEAPELVQQQVEEALAEEPEQDESKQGSLFKRLQERLGKTRDSFVHKMDSLLLGKKEIDQELFDELEELLITADLGVETSMDLLEYARKTVKRDKLSDPASLKGVLKQRILEYVKAADQPAEMVMPDKGPFVIMVVGVNGVGKTTTIGKIANKFVSAGQSVLLVAGDTFRAAAIDQLKIWGERVGVEVVAQKPGSDPSSVVFDGMEYGLAHKYDVIIIDTAGRLHTSVNLMEELKKIKRVIGKKLSSAPHEVMLVIDATTGQNGISQAKLFDAAVDITGLTLSKLDGTAKGGIVANICREMRIPVRFIGIGEQMDDLRDFDSSEFVDALFADAAQES